ncbi:MAG TPA: zeta toxin family protein [Mucilaginibacter sp.]|jgi:predicted ABC-type ATPase|nr:zeta toxin family protein [Mucilaginibacter sp.]
MSLLIIIGGPNGSGKTTLTSYLVQKGRIKSSVINPDEIAFKELGGYEFQFKASRIALARRKEAVASNSDIAFETTFSGNTEINEILTAKAAGYKVILYYVALRSMLDNIIRVEQRITNAGHDVETEDISRRYLKSKLNLEKHLDLFDKAYLFDNSTSIRSRVALFGNGKLLWLNKKHINHPFYKDILK